MSAYGEWYPIHAAAQEGNCKALVKLLKKQKDGVNKGDSANRKPLHLAAAAGREVMVTFLLDKLRADINAADNVCVFFFFEIHFSIFSNFSIFFFFYRTATHLFCRHLKPINWIWLKC
jgi:ankyrin repeat protein